MRKEVLIMTETETVRVTTVIKTQLDDLKYELKARSLNEVITKLIQKWKEGNR